MKSTTSNSIRTTFAIAITTVGLLASNGVNAASACIGLDNAACGSAASCGWVQGYERKDGRKVSSFCRTKSGKKVKTTIDNKSTK
tara:strand:- start:1182 stop:1436 length:255 start_codon:yes stop_codon:yes gene_type:complete